jgi:hypothetical protein
MISIETKGRLGNQLFEYATCRSIAEKNNYNFYFIIHPFWNQIKRFNLSSGKIDGNIKYQLNSDKCTKYLFDNNKLPDYYLNINDNTLLTGYFQRCEFFDFNYKNIKKWFDVNNLIDMNHFNNLYEKYKDYCLIHIRGTDFIGGNEVPLSYYKKSIKHILEIDNNIKFLIVTDDITHSKKLFPDIECISNSDYLIDYKLLQTSKYLISSNSTFSWWAGYLSEKAEKIIYPYGGLNYGKDTHIFSKCDRFHYI